MSSTGETSQKEQKSNQNIQVYVRVRPTNTREKLIKSNEVVEVQNHRDVIAKQLVDSRTKKFTFDKAFGMDSKQHDVYKVVVAPLIEEVLSGYNCTVFAYGQTGTGKTYTMVGEEQPNLCSSWDDPSDVGIIPRALNHLFDELRLMDVEFAMRVSYLELYNEELCDLLSTDDSVKIRIFDDANKKGSVIVQGLEEIPVKGKDDVYKLLATGQERRRTATTLMNAQSSRSHTVFSILVHIKENNVDGEEMLKIGKLNLVDLAGSENISKAGNEKGIRTRETVNINQSLLTLGRVITALVERRPHIPYRESKLTRLLQESLGGRTKTSIIATVSPGHKDLDETLSTLEYAHRAKNIQNKPEINQRLTKKAVLKEYTEEIDRLKRDLMAARDKNGIYLAEDTYNDMLYKMEEQTKELNDKVLYLKALKDELASKTKLFEETQYHLEIVSENLAKSQDRMRITEADLVRAKKNLKHSKRKNEEKKFLLNQHMKTEAMLTNQAQELIQVATVASTDTKELHETIERRKTVEERVQMACDELTTNLNDYIHNMKLDMNQLTKKHSDNSNIIVHELKQNFTEHKKHILELGKFWESVRIANEMSRSTVLQQVAEWRNQLQSKSDHDLDGIFQVLKQIEEKSENFNNYLTERIMAVTTQIYSEEKKNDNVLRGVISRLQNLNNNVENVCKHVTTNLSGFEEKLRAMDKKSHDDIKDQLAQEKIINEKQSKKLMEIRKMLDEVEDMQSQLNHNRETIETTNNDYLEKKMNVYNDLNVNPKCLQTCHEDVASDAKEMQLSLEKIQESAKMCVNQQNHELIEVKTKAKELNDQLVDCVHTDLNHLNGHRDHLNENFHQITKTVQETNDKNDKDMLEKHEQLSGMVTSEKGRLDTVNTNIETYVKGILNHIVQESEGHVMESLMKCADEISNFRDERLVKYEPTGSTPARKDYQFNRCLAATSPHDRLIRRMRFESGGNSELDVSITILEDDESVTSPDLNSTSTEITNSTPVKDNLQKGRPLQNLEISKVMNEQNKENIGNTWAQN